MSFGATYGAISLNNVFNSALYRDIYEILLVRLRAPYHGAYPYFCDKLYLRKIWTVNFKVWLFINNN